MWLSRRAGWVTTVGAGYRRARSMLCPSLLVAALAPVISLLAFLPASAHAANRRAHHHRHHRGGQVPRRVTYFGSTSEGETVGFSLINGSVLHFGLPLQLSCSNPSTPSEEVIAHAPEMRLDAHGNFSLTANAEAEGGSSEEISGHLAGQEVSGSVTMNHVQYVTPGEGGGPVEGDFCAGSATYTATPTTSSGSGGRPGR